MNEKEKQPDYFVFPVMTSSCLFVFFCAEEKPEAAVDDWEAIATDEEKGQSFQIIKSLSA